MSGPTPRTRRLSLPSLFASVAWGCAFALLASCGGEAAGLRPVGDDGFEVATEEDQHRFLVIRGDVYLAGPGDPTLVMAAARLERGGVRVDRAEIGALSLEADRASYVRGELGQEWYELRDGDSLEQGWSLAAPPGDRADGGLELVLELGPDVELVRESEDSVEVQVPQGQVTYSGPAAHDASGTPLTATLATRDGAVVLSIDDSSAEYPIEIDPLYAFISTGVSSSAGRTVHYGESIAIDGDHMFVGQPDRAAGGGFIQGAVVQFERVGTSWVYQRQIRIAGTSTDAGFGTVVDVDVNAAGEGWLVANAPGDTAYGAVYAIQTHGGFNTSGVPAVFRQIVSPESLVTFGQSVSISGTRLAVGGLLLGKVYVFNWNGSAWANTTAHRPTATGGRSFGVSVALARNNPNLLVVGAPTNTTNGRVFIFRWNGSSWGTPATIVPLTSPSQQTRFGISVAVSGSSNAEHVAIGSFAYSGTRAQLSRTIYSTSSGWAAPTLEITAAGYLSTTETFQYAVANRAPHVGIAPDSSSSGQDILLLALPNAVASSGGTGTVVGTHTALPSGISNVQRTLSSITGIHRGRAIATDGATVAVAHEYQPSGGALGGYVEVHRIAWANGTSCTTATASQCASGICVDNVCCNSSCGSGSLTDCIACSTARGASTNGSCGALTAAAAPTVTCRASAGVCDPAETCVAGSTTCPANAFRPSSYQCGNSSGVGCDANDFCTGSSASCPNLVQPNGYVCRPAAAGTCDRAETCDGSSLACPVDKPQDPGTPCGSDTTDPCDAPDVCDGSSFVCPELASSSATICRPSVSGCDDAEKCTGSSIVCPANAPPRPLGTVCRIENPLVLCDAEETCNGTSYTCPPDAPALAGKPCRASTGVCDAAEECNGSSFHCPGDAREPLGTPCRDAAGTCDLAESCNGTDPTCPIDLLEAAGVVCRSAAANTCDRPEQCTGSSALCPTDIPQPAGTPCGSDTTDPCDAPDVCNGSSFVCPELASPAGTTCRDAVSLCDTAETCSGSSIVCPVNAPPEPAGTVCRFKNPSLACDAQETCSGSAYTCPADAPATAGTPCRDAAGVCDRAESCSGSSFSCPPDLREDAFTLCRGASNTTAPGTSDCDVPEYCDGTSVGCPSDVGGSFAECCSASEWSDGEQCRTDYLCVDATCTLRGCGDGWLEGSEQCEDRNAVDGDACSAECAPTTFAVAARPDGIDVPGERSVAIDGQGRVLVVWSEENETSTRIRARRYTQYGTDPAGTPAITEIASLPGPGWDAAPVLTALADGWAIAWRQPAAAEVSAVVAARISSTGVLGTAIRVSHTSETLALDPGIAALSDGTLLVTWTDATDPTTPVVRYQWIVGTAVSSLPRAIFGTAGGDAVVAASGTTAMIVWTEEPALGERPRILARRLTRTAAIDATPLVIATNAMQPTVSGGASHFAIGWVGRQDDPDGDIFALVAPLAGAITATPAHVTDPLDPDRPFAELAPSILAHGSGWIVGWEVPSQLSARVAAGGGVTLPLELVTTLEPALNDYLAADLSLASSARGTWVVWSAASAPASGAARATWGFILPPS